MKLPIPPLPISFTEAQRKVLIRALTWSAVGCVALVAVVWTAKTLSLRAALKSDHAIAGDEMLVWEQKSKELMDMDVDAHVMAARHYLAIDQAPLAIPHLLRILPIRKQNRGLRSDLGTAYLESGEYPKALEVFRLLEDEGLTDSIAPIAAARYGLTLFYLAKTSEALTHLEAAAVKYPASAEAVCYLGEVEAAVKTPSAKAEQYLQRAVQLDPLFPEARYQQARYLMNVGQNLAARDSLLRILDISPLHVRTYSRLGMAYYYLGEPSMARKSYETALALNPRDQNTHYNLGELLYTSLDDEKGALAEFRKAVSINPHLAEANFKIGSICLRNNMLKESITYLEKACEESPRNTRFMMQLAAAFERLSMRDRASEIYGEIAAIDPLNRIASQKAAEMPGGVETFETGQ